ncbi:MAG: TlpA disulfide reductase family protein [Proteocatella sp.]
MKKTLKALGIVLVIGFGLAVTFLMPGVKMIGPSDPIILTQEEEKQQNAEQVNLYQDVDLAGFNTVDVNGNQVTSDIFKDSEITMINLWFTGCSPCIAEMPEIASLYNTRPEGSNIISICCDTFEDRDSTEFAKEVMDDAEAKFATLVPDVRIQEALTDRTNIFPTTIFVDSEGKLVGDVYLGGRTQDDYRQAILDRLVMVEAQ